MGLIEKFKNLPTQNEITGSVGEQLTKLIAKIDIPEALILQDVLLDGADGQTTQIDLLLIDKKGIYVIEVKNFKNAKVYGDSGRLSGITTEAVISILSTILICKTKITSST